MNLRYSHVDVSCACHVAMSVSKRSQPTIAITPRPQSLLQEPRFPSFESESQKMSIGIIWSLAMPKYILRTCQGNLRPMPRLPMFFIVVPFPSWDWHASKSLQGATEFSSVPTPHQRSSHCTKNRHGNDQQPPWSPWRVGPSDESNKKVSGDGSQGGPFLVSMLGDQHLTTLRLESQHLFWYQNVSQTLERNHASIRKHSEHSWLVTNKHKV